MIRTKQLATNENERLAHCEGIIERGFTVFVEVGKALAEIRDAKLYRDNHKTFEEYCKARWDIGRSRAYELIDQAKVNAAVTDAGVDLSATADISKREVRVLKADLSGAAQEIKARVDKGEPADTAMKAVALSRQQAAQARQAEFDRQREEAKAALPEAVKETKPAPADDDHDALLAELEEARETIAALEKDVARLKAENQKYAEMKALFDKGGFEKVIEAKDETIRVQATRIERESGDKVSWKRTADLWRKRAEEAGWSNDVTIDLETGEVIDA